MSFFEDYRDMLVSLVDKNPPQKLKIKYFPERRWNAVDISVTPEFDPIPNIKETFLGNSIRANVILTSEGKQLVARVAVVCDTESLFTTCVDILVGFYESQSDVTYKKLRADGTFLWLRNILRYQYNETLAFHKNIFDLAKYAHDNTAVLSADHKKNILALISLLKGKIQNGKKSTT